MNTFTLDTLDDDGFDELTPDTRSAPPTPRLSVLYSADLSRIGAVTPPGVLSGGEQVPVGRASPIFESPHIPGDGPRPLGDPYLSRQQLLVRWDAARRSFEVTPLPGARRKIACLVETSSGLVLEALSEPAIMPPGSVVAFGQRVLIGLDLAPWRPASCDRMGMVGESSAMWSMRERVSQIADFDGPVLLLGETGTGKERVARAIHNQSTRSSRPFVAINCAALPEALAEGVLFGHKKGAFTGALREEAGVFAEAEGGTLLLDELGELPLGLQAKLLRVLQEGRFLPLGHTKEHLTNARIIAATNRDPHTEIAAGRLRQDLFYRLNTHTLTLPPLRERRSDTLTLLTHFLHHQHRAHPALGWLWQSPAPKKPGLPLSFALDLLGASWQGNIRELESTAEQIASFNLTPGPFKAPNLSTISAPEKKKPTPTRAYDTVLTEASAALGLTRKVTRALLPEVVLLPLDGRALAEGSALATHLDDAIAKHLYDMLTERAHNQTELAGTMGVSRTTLVKLMRRFGLRRPVDCSDDLLLTAWRAADGDVHAMARSLRLSPLALKTHLTKTGLLDQ